MGISSRFRQRWVEPLPRFPYPGNPPHRFSCFVHRRILRKMQFSLLTPEAKERVLAEDLVPGQFFFRWTVSQYRHLVQACRFGAPGAGSGKHRTLKAQHCPYRRTGKLSSEFIPRRKGQTHVGGGKTSPVV